MSEPRADNLLCTINNDSYKYIHSLLSIKIYNNKYHENQLTLVFWLLLIIKRMKIQPYRVLNRFLTVLV